MTTRIHWAAYTLATALLAGCGGGADDPLAPSGQSRQPRPDSVGTTDTIQVHPTLGTLDRQPHRGPLQRAVNPFDIGGEASPSGQLASGRGGYLTGGVGTFRLELAPDLSGRVVFPRMAQAQGDRYYLGVDRFFGPGTVELVSVRRGTGTQLQVVVKFTHPFPQPTDLARPATARKRVDLHIFNVWAGTLIQGTESYFSGADAETTNTQAMLNADTYRELGALVNRPAGVTATVFPGKWVGDQSPNNTDPNLDNYFPNANGWVGTDLLTPRGYGVFPQGGESSVTFLLDPGNAGGPINVDFAILADYQDPRALPDVRANRLPDPFDATQLRYILPYGAGDLQQIDVQVSGTLRDNNATTATVTANIVDLDADAPVATGGWPNNANLNEMPASSGIKSVSASFPQLDSATLTGTEAAGSGSGLPGNPKKWELPLANPLLAAAGDYTGLVRVVDEETDSMNSEPYFQLDPNLVPLATKLPIQAFQAAEVTVTGTTGGGTRTIVIKNDPDNDDPSFVLSLGGDPPDLTSWIDDPATQAIGGLTFDDVVGSPLFAFEGTGFYAAPNETRFGRGIFAVFFNDPSNGGNFGIRLLGFLNPATAPDPAARRANFLSAYVVSEAFVDGSAFPTPNPNARGYFGWADLATAFWLSSAPQFDGRAALPLLDDFDGYYNDPTTWTANHPDGLTIRLTDFTGTAPEVNPDHMPGVEQGMIADLVDVDYVRAGGAREANANDLVIIQGLKGPYNPAQVAPPTITQIYTLLDLDDPDTPEAEPWANFLWAGPTANSQNRPTLMGAGTGAINPMTTVGADMANDADRLYIADSADNNVETYQVVPNGLDGLADESQDEHWMFLGVNSAAGDITTPIDLAVTGDGAGGSYVVVLDSGGANNGYRLLVMDPATLAVMATRDITDEGDITTGALSIAADESGVNVPGDLTAFALLWDDPLGSNSEIGPVGGMNWYVITNP